jgi:hypothetical protein
VRRSKQTAPKHSTEITGNGHSLTYSTQANLQGEEFKDLTPLTRTIFVGVHSIWFLCFVVAVLMFSKH